MGLGQGLAVRLEVLAHGGIEGGLGVVQGLQAGFELVPCADEGVHRLIQLALAGAGGPVTDPQALLEQGAQAGVDRLLGLHLAHGGLVGAELHDGMRLLQPVTAILQVDLEAVGLVHEVLQGTVPAPAPVVGQGPRAEADDEHD